MKIKYSHAAGITAILPQGDALTRHAAEAYGYTLNTPERLNVWHDGPQFAAAIAEVCDPVECHNAAIIAHLSSLTPEPEPRTRPQPLDLRPGLTDR